MKAAPCLLLCCLGLCLLIPAWSFAAGQGGLIVESVSFHRDKAPSERIRIKLSGPHTPKAFTMEGDNKPRLIFDFVGARYAGLVTPVVNGSDTLVKRIRVGVHAEPVPKVRVVLDLEPGRNYTYTREFLKQENVLNVNLIPAEPANSPEPSVTRIDAEVAKQKVVGGSKKAVVLTAPVAVKHQSPAVVEPAAKTAPAEKPAQPASTAAVQPPVAEVEKPVKSPVDRPVVEAQVAGKPAKPEQATLQENAGQDKKQPAAKSDADIPAKAAAVNVPEEGATVKSPAVPPRQPAGNVAEEKKKTVEPAAPAEPAVPVDPAAAKVPERTKAERTKAKQARAERAKAKQARNAQKPPKRKAAAVQLEEPAAADPQLLDVTYENNSSKGEMVFFHLNGFFPPNVSAVESDSPQVVCEFLNMTKVAKIKPVIEARGAYVQKIETTAGKDPKKIKVVLTLAPHRDYDLRQVFFKEDNLFVLVVNTMDEESVKPADRQD